MQSVLPTASAPLTQLPNWGPRLETDLGSLELHQPTGFSVTLKLSRHLLTCYRSTATVERAVGSDHLRTQSLRRGTINFTPAGVDLKAVAEQPLTALLVCLAPPLLARVSVAAQRGHTAIEALSALPAAAPLRQLCDLACGLFHRAVPPDTLYVESMLTLIAAELLPVFPPGALSPARSLHGARGQRVLEFIDAHLAEPLRLGQLAAVAHMSTYHFARSFKSWMGVAPYRYVQQQRLARARRLLLGTELAVSAVAEACGFAQPGSLSAALRASTGYTPQALRRAARA